MPWRKQTSRNERTKASVRVYSVVSLEYMQLGLAWGKRVEEVSDQKPIFVCSDSESFEFLNAHGFQCNFKPSAIPLSGTELSATGTERWKGGKFHSDKAVYTNALKFVMAAEFLKSGQSVLYSDVDAIWIRNPIPCVLEQNADIVFQPGHARKRKSHGWSIEACAGFFLYAQFLSYSKIS